MDKYANQYFDQVSKSLGGIADQTATAVKNYHPFDTTQALTEGAPALGAIGAGIGGIAGAVKEPGYDSHGHKKSRVSEAIKGMLAGGGIGVGAALAAPTIAQGVTSLQGNARDAAIGAGTPEGGLLESLMKPVKHTANAAVTAGDKAMLPSVSVADLLSRISNKQ